MAKSTNILIRVTPEEKAAIEQAAIVAQMTLSAYVRSRVLSQAPNPPPTPPKAAKKPHKGVCPRHTRQGYSEPVPRCPVCKP
jgi:hypothetical protein